MSANTETKIRSLARTMIVQLEALNLGEARETAYEIIRLGWREAHTRIEAAHETVGHIADLNVGKALLCAQQMAESAPLIRVA